MQDDTNDTEVITLPPTLTDQVAALEQGETASIIRNLCDRPESNVRLSKLEGSMAGHRNKLRNSVGSVVRGASKRTGFGYSVEICDLFAPSGRLFLIALITRT